MLQLSTQAGSIITRLGTITSLGQTGYLDTVDDLDRRQVTLPIAQLVMSKAELAKPGNRSTNSEASWIVLVSSKDTEGPGGLLVLVDAVLDALSGFTPLLGVLPLYPLKIEYIKKIGETATYGITFSTTQRAKYTPRT